MNFLLFERSPCAHHAPNNLQILWAYCCQLIGQFPLWSEWNHHFYCHFHLFRFQKHGKFCVIHAVAKNWYFFSSFQYLLLSSTRHNTIVKWACPLNTIICSNFWFWEMQVLAKLAFSINTPMECFDRILHRLSVWTSEKKEWWVMFNDKSSKHSSCKTNFTPI